MRAKKKVAVKKRAVDLMCYELAFCVLLGVLRMGSLFSARAEERAMAIMIEFTMAYRTETCTQVSMARRYADIHLISSLYEQVGCTSMLLLPRLARFKLVRWTSSNAVSRVNQMLSLPRLGAVNDYSFVWRLIDISARVDAFPTYRWRLF